MPPRASISSFLDLAPQMMMSNKVVKQESPVYSSEWGSFGAQRIKLEREIFGARSGESMFSGSIASNINSSVMSRSNDNNNNNRP